MAETDDADESTYSDLMAASLSISRSRREKYNSGKLNGVPCSTLMKK